MEALYIAALTFLSWQLVARQNRLAEQERYRAHLFGLRDELFDLAMSKETNLAFDHPSYVDTNRRLNSLLRFAHKVTPSWITNALREFNRLPKEITRQVYRLETPPAPKDVEDDVNEIRDEIWRATSHYLVAQSLALRSIWEAGRVVRWLSRHVLAQSGRQKDTTGKKWLKRATNATIAESVREYQAVPSVAC